MRLDFTLEVPRPRFVVVHYHFFKNAGSTIKSILEREFATLSLALLSGAEG
jgi:hypothetical protein